MSIHSSYSFTEFVNYVLLRVKKPVQHISVNLSYFGDVELSHLLMLYTIYNLTLTLNPF